MKRLFYDGVELVVHRVFAVNQPYLFRVMCDKFTEVEVHFPALEALVVRKLRYFQHGLLRPDPGMPGLGDSARDSRVSLRRPELPIRRDHVPCRCKDKRESDERGHTDRSFGPEESTVQP